jgi:hypothetical protein
MSDGPAGTVPARPPEDGSAGAELCVLLACFAGAKRAAKILPRMSWTGCTSGSATSSRAVPVALAMARLQRSRPSQVLISVTRP